MKESDTPRTDQLMHGGCVAINILEHARELERELAISLENQLKAVNQLTSSRAQSHGMARRVVEAETKLEVVQSEVDRLTKEVERLKSIKQIKLSMRPYSYECGDGCCSEDGETWFVDGEEVASGPCDANRLQQLLKHLGYDARIVNENEDGEEVCKI